MFKRIFKYGFIGFMLGLAQGYALNANPVHFFGIVFAVVFAGVGFFVELLSMFMDRTARRARSRRGKAKDLWWKDVAR